MSETPAKLARERKCLRSKTIERLSSTPNPWPCFPYGRQQLEDFCGVFSTTFALVHKSSLILVRQSVFHDSVQRRLVAAVSRAQSSEHPCKIFCANAPHPVCPMRLVAKLGDINLLFRHASSPLTVRTAVEVRSDWQNTHLEQHDHIR